MNKVNKVKEHAALVIEDLESDNPRFGFSTSGALHCGDVQCVSCPIGPDCSHLGNIQDTDEFYQYMLRHPEKFI